MSQAGEATRAGGMTRAGSGEVSWAWVVTWTGPGQARLVALLHALVHW